MTAKEKADELVSKFEESLFGYNVLFDEDYVKCINCALVAVDEIMKAGSDVDEYSECYWQEVKIELKKL